MDVLSDAVLTMRAGRPHSNRNLLRAPWGVRFPATDGAQSAPRCAPTRAMPGLAIEPE